MEPATDPGAWVSFGEFLVRSFGPGGAVAVAFCIAEGCALWKLITYFSARDDQKRGDVLNIVKETKEALAGLSTAVTHLKVVVAAQTGRTDV